MCLIITACAALVAALVWHLSGRNARYKLGILTAMYGGAALMWLSDSIFSVKEGGAFFEVSANDATLGMLIVLCGLGAWLVLHLIDRQKRLAAGSK